MKWESDSCRDALTGGWSFMYYFCDLQSCIQAMKASSRRWHCGDVFAASWMLVITMWQCPRRLWIAMWFCYKHRSMCSAFALFGKELWKHSGDGWEHHSCYIGMVWSLVSNGQIINDLCFFKQSIPDSIRNCNETLCLILCWGDPMWCHIPNVWGSTTWAWSPWRGPLGTCNDGCVLDAFCAVTFYWSMLGNITDI